MHVIEKEMNAIMPLTKHLLIYSFVRCHPHFSNRKSSTKHLKKTLHLGTGYHDMIGSNPIVYTHKKKKNT